MANFPSHFVGQVVGTLKQASLFLSMLMRASAAFPRELSPRDHAMRAAIQSAVAELEQVCGTWALHCASADFFLLFDH